MPEPGCQPRLLVVVLVLMRLPMLVGVPIPVVVCVPVVVVMLGVVVVPSLVTAGMRVAHNH